MIHRNQKLTFLHLFTNMFHQSFFLTEKKKGKEKNHNETDLYINADKLTSDLMCIKLFKLVSTLPFAIAEYTAFADSSGIFICHNMHPIKSS